MNKMTLGAAMEARMTRILLLVGIAATTLGAGTQAQAACNARGEHCGRPVWAVNALSGRYDRIPKSAVEPPKHYQAVRPSQRVHIEKVDRAIKKAAPAKVVPLVKFADGEGRQFDPASQVWFDGESRCWSGAKQFTFKDGDWFYGKREWIEDNGTWKAVAGELPELVSCESVPSFAAKAKAFAAKTAAPASKKAENADTGAASQPTPVTPAPSKIKTAGAIARPLRQKPIITPRRRMQEVLRQRWPDDHRPMHGIA